MLKDKRIYEHSFTSVSEQGRSKARQKVFSGLKAG